MAHPYDNIPTLLKQHPNWVVWGIRAAPLKSPFNPASLLAGKSMPAKAGVKETWGSYQQATECVARGLAQGIGYEFDGNDLYGVDLDHVVDDTGRISPEAREVVGTLNSYTEVSPSGHGLHTFVFAPGADITRHRKKDHFLEIYNEGRYFTVTGNAFYAKHVGVKPIATRTAELQAMHDKFLLPDPSRRETTAASPMAVMPMSDAAAAASLKTGLSRDKTLDALWQGERRHGNESTDDIALMNKLAYWCNADTDAMVSAFLQSPFYAKKDDAHKKKCDRADYLPKTAAKSAASVRSTAKEDAERWKQNRQHTGAAR